MGGVCATSTNALIHGDENPIPDYLYQNCKSSMSVIVKSMETEKTPHVTYNYMLLEKKDYFRSTFFLISAPVTIKTYISIKVKSK